MMSLCKINAKPIIQVFVKWNPPFTRRGKGEDTPMAASYVGLKYYVITSRREGKGHASIIGKCGIEK